MVAPSYNCNASCSYCYAKDFVKKFNQEMSFGDFVKIADCHIKEGGKTISIIGGEPLLWKHIEKAVMYCRLKKIKTTIFTNGLETIKIAPDLVYLNVSHYFEKFKKMRVERSLRYYEEKKIKVVLRYNVEERKKNFEKINEIISLAKRSKFFKIHIAPAVPYKIDREMGDFIYNLVKKVNDDGIPVLLANPLPPCLFNEEEVAYLKKNSGLYFKCNLGGMPLINPDGKTMQPCPKLPIYKIIKNFGDIKKAGEIFSSEIDKLRKKISDKCQNCSYYKEKKCDSGCLATLTINDNPDVVDKYN
jgi:MoaA/NifB/PqqE/SkfB family radical SAM enzyme